MNMVIALNLSQEADSIRGFSTFFYPGALDSIRLQIHGRFFNPDVSLSLSDSLGFYNEIQFSGNLVQDSLLIGKLNGSGLIDLAIIFIRQKSQL